MATTQDKAYDFCSSLSKVATFLQDLLSRETLNVEAEKGRQECIRHVQEMISALQGMEMNGKADSGQSNLLRVGLSNSTQELNDVTADASDDVNGLTRSDSLPNVSNGAIQGLYKHRDLQQDVNINDLRQLILYEPIQEENDEHIEVEEKLKLASNNVHESPKRSRKRDSAALFDITLGDLMEPDFSGFLTEKHSGKEWWCVLQDMHLCMFPSRNPDEVAYDVIIIPCCQITLDDRLLRTPVFRLTQSGMVPWVLVAKDTRDLKEWMNVLTVATTGGSYGATNKPPDKPTTKVAAKPQMFAIEEEEDDNIEEIPGEVNLIHVSSVTGELCSKSVESSEFKNETVEVAEADTSHSSPENTAYPAALPTLTMNAEREYGEDFIYTSPHGGDEFEDDGFATDEFDSGSSDGEIAGSSASASPQLVRKLKKKKFFKWLKKKSRKHKLFSSPDDGVTLAGYAQRLENNACSKRWFLVREGKLHCYKTIKDEGPEEILILEGTDIKIGDEDKSKLSVKVLKDGVIKFVLVAKSVKDLERWKTALKIESGFIKHGSPTSSGIYEEEDDGDYVMPASSPGLPRTFVSSASSAVDETGGIDHEDEDLYMEVVPIAAVTPPVPRSPIQEGLGPLPAIPQDLPPRPECEEAESDISDYEYEVYEEVGTSIPHADKVNQWAEIETKAANDDLYLNDFRDREAENGEVEEHKDVEKNDVELKDEKKSNRTSEESHKAKGPCPAGVGDGSIPDSAMTASSFLDNFKPSLGRLNTKSAVKQTGAWCAKVNDKAQFLQIDLGDTTKVCGVATQGRSDGVEDGGCYVKTYTVAYSKDGENWVNYKEFGIAKVFQGNTDSEKTVTNHLKRAVNARYVRIKPQTWNSHIAMRIEVYKGVASSKLEAGIHKLAATLTKAGKGKTFDKQLTSSTETLESKPGFDETVSPTEKTPLARRVSFDEYVKLIAENSEEETKQEEQSAGEESREEQALEADVQHKIEETKRADGGVKTISRVDVSESVRTKTQVYVNSESKAKCEEKSVKTVITLEKKISKTEKTADISTAANSATDTDRERQMLEKTEQAFLDFAKKLNNDDISHKIEKTDSLVAAQKLNFERLRSAKESKTQTKNQEPTDLQKEKEELTSKLESLKRRVTIAKDRKVFFGRSDGKSTAVSAADTELQNAQAELAKAKERMKFLEGRVKNTKVLELRYQKTTIADNSPAKPAPMIRRNSREVKIGTFDRPMPKVDSKNFNPDGEKAQQGSVLSQIKAFEKLKE